MANLANSGFISHAKLSFTEHPEQYAENYTKNNLEKVGQLLLWHVIEIPQSVYKAAHNPKVLTVAFTILAMTVVQFAFYPITSLLALQKVVTLLSPIFTKFAVKLASYTLIQAAILGWGIRSMGRFTNQQLMGGFYAQQLPEGVDA